MSELERDFLKAKLGKLPLVPPVLHQDDDEDDLEELDQVGELATPSTSKEYDGLETLSGSEFFEEALQVHPPGNDTTFRVYYTPPRPRDASCGTLFIFHHGLGYSGLSFALAAKQLHSSCRGECGLAAIDGRGHGKTQGPNQYDLTLDQMSSDLVDVVQELIPDRSKAPKFVLGGPVIVEAAPRIQKQVADVIGIAVLDVVEGTARDALHNMHAYLAKLPTGFDSIQRAISWFVKSRTVNNPESLRVSAPPLFIEAAPDSPHKFVWRTDLAQTEPHWASWFEGLSQKFLGVKAAKLLVLAGTDRLDTDLIVGQMQGKFQLSIIPEAGHCLNEDTPKKLAGILLEFWRRNDMTDILKNVKKVGQA